LVYRFPPSHQIDHINGDRTDNRLENLREATNSENQYNSKTRKDNKLGIKGISCYREGKYRAYTRDNGKKIHIGCFDTLEEAKAAYDKAASTIHGEFFRS
jgi:hypothetical protein